MSSLATVNGMEKKPKPVGRPPKEENKDLVDLFVQISPRLRQVVEDLKDQEERSLRVTVARLLQEALQVRGLWPPPEETE